MGLNPKSEIRNPKLQRLVPALLDWFLRNARDLPWRRTRDPYAIWVSEIMLQQTQVKTVIPFWERWMRALPTIRAAANASPDKIHKLWEGLGYYTRVRNLQKAAQVLVEKHHGTFPQIFDDVLALPGVGRYSAGAICSIAFNQPTPILDGNVIRVLTRVFGIGENPKERAANLKLWKLAEELVCHAKTFRPAEAPGEPARDDARLNKNQNCSHLNQSLMELGALVCTPRQPQCPACPVRKFCAAFRDKRVGELPKLDKRTLATARHFTAFVVERQGRVLVRQRPGGVVNAHLWEFPNIESDGAAAKDVFKSIFGITPPILQPLCTVKHSITRYRITLEAYLAQFGGRSFTMRKIPRARGVHPSESSGVWLTPAEMRRLAFSSAHKKLVSAAADCILSGR